MASTVWKGHLTFGLVSIPVRLFRAARKERVRLRQLYRPQVEEVSEQARRPFLVDADEAETAEPAPVVPIQQGAFTREHEEPIPRTEIVKGHELEKGRFVVIEREEIERITPKTATEMQIVEFVKMAEIDAVYLESSYYVSPEEAGEKAYALLYDAMRESGYVALAEFAMRGRQHAVVIRPGTTGIIAHTMFYSDEVRNIEEFRTDTSAVGKKERELAMTLVTAMAVHFDPEKFKDTYREKLQELIAAKIEGREIAAEAPVKTAAPADIMEALKESLALRRKPVRGERPRLKGKKRTV